MALASIYADTVNSSAGELDNYSAVKLTLCVK